MYPKMLVNLGNFILSISDAIDLAFPSLAMHQQRVALTAWEMGKMAGLDEKRIERVFLAALLHDIGAMSIEEKKSLHDNEASGTEAHAIRGCTLFKSCPWLADGADLVRHHHREWTAWGERKDTPVAFDSQLLFLADFLERHIDRGTYILHQNEALRSRVKELSGSMFCPGVVDLFLEASCREEFWLDLTSPRLYSLLLHYGPFKHIEIGIENILVFARLLAMIVDFKSPFTATHSSGVARCAMLLAKMAGMSDSEVQLMEAAGLLHDIGKLVIPNSILEKPSRLTVMEMAIIRQHPYHTFSVLNSITGFQMIADWAGYHHERLDGNGYPFHRKSSGISLGARIIAVSDIFTALTEDRPYRKGMDMKKAAAILTEMSSQGAIDPGLVNLLIQNMAEIGRDVQERQVQVHRYYQNGIENLEAA